MNKSEYKKRYDPNLGMYVKKHVHGGGVLTDVLKSVFGKTMKEAAKTAGKKALETAATKTGEHVGKKAGDKIIQLLSRKNKDSPEMLMPGNMVPQIKFQTMTQSEIDERVNRIISGGRLRNYVN